MEQPFNTFTWLESWRRTDGGYYSVIHNMQLYQACENWLRETLPLLIDKPLPLLEDVHVIFTDAGWSTEPTLPRPFYGALVSTQKHAILQLPTFDRLAGVVRQTPEISPVLLVDFGDQELPQDRQKDWLLDHYFLKFIALYLEDGGDFDFNPEIYQRLYVKLEKFIYLSEPIHAVWLIYIRNLTSEAKPVFLERDVQLRHATEEEKAHEVKKSLTLPGTGFPVYVPETLLEIRHTIDRTGWPDQNPADTIAKAVELALRLIKPNPVGVSSLRWRVLDQPFRSLTGFSGGRALIPSAFSGERYVLTQELAAQLQNLYPKVKKAFTDPTLETPRTRLDDSYQRTKAEDRLIDFWIALEALLFPEERITEMRYAIALSTSNYLGRTASERKKIYEDIGDSYKWRSYT